MSTFSKAAPFIDAPSCSATSTTGTRCSTPDAVEGRSPTRSTQKGEVALIGYAGGGVRNIFSQQVRPAPWRKLQGPEGAACRRADLEQDLRRRSACRRP
jgi:hypothetical protein